MFTIDILDFKKFFKFYTNYVYKTIYKKKLALLRKLKYYN